MTQTKNILIVGVGGQGTLLSSKIMGQVLVEQGFDVKVSEVHGMSQRGGSVVTYVRYGERVDSPLIDKGEADILLAFEQLEAARWLPYLKPNGILIVNTQQIDPMSVIMGQAAYPQDILPTLSELGVSVLSADALSLAMTAGSAKAVNMVLVGMASRFLPFPKETWLNVLRTSVPPKTVAVNEAAFLSGYEIGAEQSAT